MNPQWARQIAIPGFGAVGQEKLKNSKVAVLGLGGVGGPAALYLTASGIGSLLLVDGDVVEASNLNRQILFSFSDLGHPKAQAAARCLLSHNPELNVEAVEKRVEERDLHQLLKGCHIVLDCFDRNRDRLAVDRVCLRQGIPAVHGFAQNFEGEIFPVLPGKSACLACALDEGFPEAEPTPVIGVATGMVGVAMASAAILSLTGLGTLSAGTRQIFDLAFTEIVKVPIEMNPHCPACGNR